MPKLYAGLMLFCAAVAAVIFTLGFIIVLPFLLLAGAVFIFMLRRHLAKMQKQADSDSWSQNSSYVVTEKTVRQNEDGTYIVSVRTTNLCDDSGPGQEAEQAAIDVEPVKAVTIEKAAEQSAENNSPAGKQDKSKD